MMIRYWRREYKTNMKDKRLRIWSHDVEGDNRDFEEEVKFLAIKAGTRGLVIRWI